MGGGFQAKISHIVTEGSSFKGVKMGRFYEANSLCGAYFEVLEPIKVWLIVFWEISDLFSEHLKYR